MTIPLILLAIGSIAGGAFLIAGDRFANFLAPVVGAPEAPHKLITPYTVHRLRADGRRVLGAAYLQYLRRPVPRTAPTASFPVVAARKDLYGDALNESLLMRPGQWLTRLTVFFDSRGVDGLVNGLAAFIGGTSGRLRRVQTGFVRSYALSMFFGAALVVGALLLVRL